ncbi:hypothetical protein Amn_29910 [Aminobacter sp. Y103A]|nr:hypothetical protein Amn_29910 [Aminobacter sp. SS-2016]
MRDSQTVFDLPHLCALLGKISMAAAKWGSAAIWRCRTSGRTRSLRSTAASPRWRTASPAASAKASSAIALAMAGGTLPSDKDFAMSINWVNFEGENGFAGTAAMRFNDNLHLHGGIGVGARHGTVGSRAGLTFAW